MHLCVSTGPREDLSFVDDWSPNISSLFHQMALHWVAVHDAATVADVMLDRGAGARLEATKVKLILTRSVRFQFMKLNWYLTVNLHMEGLKFM